ncbi:o-succinylbenzoate synthase [Bacteroidetes bacterium endosymbiont of Geopemphigus sp.]|uniref:o-succinylbenzoate synthase n=1 Tax=Bacteroidetes bacterium endosymbiont of Geopemphigus sp. TaxID=2047937 RepID=UPI000CD2C708|nr:o-succinylbenzoate synthase [Bacteroidetes bacterium endosymbiont of Geopemphigus sp.]
MRARYKKCVFHFRVASGTSRGMFYKRESWFIRLEDQGRLGTGECAPLQGLSRDNLSDYEEKIQWLCKNIYKEIDDLYQQLKDYPSIVFGLEQALLSLEKNDFILFPSDFTSGVQGIPINGLIWMGSIDFMQAQLHQKIQQGFSCIKIKIGALCFEKEYEFLARVREKYPDIELRLDANGAFSPDEIMQKLERLSAFKIHSIEQPIRAGQREIMAQLCRETPIPIVLDEELIGGFTYKDKQELFEKIAPHYFVLKPSLCGGFRAAKEWIDIAGKKNISWWITSALESNIGLNAIAQWTYSLDNPMPQGLGTGGLYTDNIPAPLAVKDQYLWYQPGKLWDLYFFK